MRYPTHVTGQSAPLYHGGDFQTARMRAEEIEGFVIFSSAPGYDQGDENAQWGYWSDSSNELVPGEQQRWPAVPAE